MKALTPLDRSYVAWPSEIPAAALSRAACVMGAALPAVVAGVVASGSGALTKKRLHRIDGDAFRPARLT